MKGAIIFLIIHKKRMENVRETDQQEQRPAPAPCRQANQLRVECPVCSRHMSLKRLKYCHVCPAPRTIKTPTEYRVDAEKHFEQRTATHRILRNRQQQGQKWSKLIQF